MRFYQKKLRPWLRKASSECSERCIDHLSERCRLVIVSVVTGLVAGVGAWTLKALIRLVSVSLTSGLGDMWGRWVLAVSPVGALLISGWMQRRLFHRDLSRGTDKLKESLSVGDCDLSSRLMYQPVLACAVTVGMGGSAGAEGPIAYAGAAVGSCVSRIMRLPPRVTRMMVGIGAAAGIAAIFKAPLGGMFFTIEVLGMSMATMPLLCLVACCLLSSFTAYMLSGMTPDVVWAGAETAFGGSLLCWAVPAGLLMGLYSRWYRSSGLSARSLWQRVSSLRVRELCGGLLLGVLIYCMPSLFGEGYGALESVLAGDTQALVRFSPLSGSEGTWVVPLMLAGILMVKGIAVYTTNNAGGVSGSFAPTLFAGCMAGALMSCGADAVGCTLPHAQVAYICMAGAMAGIVRAPLMATFITVEVTMTYDMLFPVAVVAFVSYAVATGRLWGLGRRCGRTNDSGTPFI